MSSKQFGMPLREMVYHSCRVHQQPDFASGKKTMDSVASPSAVTVVSWDAALAAVLPATASRAYVHSRHRHVVNVLVPGDRLLALATADLDDAPCTVRLSGWPILAERIGSRLLVSRRELRFADGLAVALASKNRWLAERVDLGRLRTDALAAARDALRGAVSDPSTAFGRASAGLLADRIRVLRARLLNAEDDSRIADAVTGLVGLGEGLTPAGDDVITGLAFFAAQRGMRLGSRLPAIRRAVVAGRERTTLLSATTMTAALDGRGRQRLHDLAAAIRNGRTEPAVPAVLAIGHSSGSDLLTGSALALDVESELRASAH